MSAPQPLSPEVSGLLEQLAQNSTGLKNGQPGAREGLLGACSALLSELSHPMETILQLLWAQPTHHVVLRLGVELKVFEKLLEDNGSPKSSEQLAAPSKAEPLLISRMMRHLAAMGSVKEVDVDRYVPTSFSAALTDPNMKDSVLFLQDDILPVHLAAPSYFAANGYRSPTDGANGPFQHAYHCKGLGFFDYFEKHSPEMGRRFGSMMGAWSTGRPRWFWEGYYDVQGRLISGSKEDGGVFLVDVGGGRGHDIEGFKETFGKVVKGALVLEDRPEVISIAQLSPGLEGLPHDFNTPQPVKGARAYFLHSIMQDWSDVENTHILKQIVPAMEPGYSKVLLNEFVLPDKGAHWALTCMDWELMSSLSARQRTVEEFHKVVEAAGLKIVGIFKHPQSADSLIECELA